MAITWSSTDPFLAELDMPHWAQICITSCRLMEDPLPACSCNQFVTHQFHSCSYKLKQELMSHELMSHEPNKQERVSPYLLEHVEPNEGHLLVDVFLLL